VASAVDNDALFGALTALKAGSSPLAAWRTIDRWTKARFPQPKDQDARQLALISIHRNVALAEASSPQSCAKWVRTIVERKKIDRARAERSRAASSLVNAQGETLEGEETDDTPVDIKERRARVRELAEAIQEGVDELEEPGGSVKDLSSGLVDFLSRRDGRTVYLCWRRGETECGWWHDLDSGYQGRRPIAEASEFEGTYVH